MKLGVFLSALVSAITLDTSGEIIFSQGFSTSTLSDYYNGHPNAGQFDAISFYPSASAAIVNGALQFQRPSGAGSNAKASFARTTDFSPPPRALIYRFDLKVSGNSSSTTGVATWQVGSGFTAANDLEAAGTVHSQLGLNLAAFNGDFSFRDLTSPAQNSSVYSGRQAITWVINNSGNPLTYWAPNATWQTVGNDKWDLWVGFINAFDERAATTATQSLTDLKFFFGAGTATIQMDNFSLDDTIIPAVPEPHFTGLLAALFLVTILLVHHLGQVGPRSDAKVSGPRMNANERQANVRTANARP